MKKCLLYKEGKEKHKEIQGTESEQKKTYLTRIAVLLRKETAKLSIILS